MKRAYLRKVKPGVSSPCSVDGVVGEPEQISRGVRRRARTSAAMVGLALSMGATGLVLPRQSDGASAAESAGTEASVAPVSQATAPVIQEASESKGAAAANSLPLVEHTVVAGETLHHVARKYQLTVGELAAANKLSTRAILQVGQVLKVPARVQGQTDSAQADPVAAPAKVSDSTSEKASADILAKRQQALNRLRLQREQLQSKLMTIRSEESPKSQSSASKERQALITELPPSASTEAAQSASSQNDKQTASIPAQAPVSVAQVAPQPEISAPASEPDWIRSNQNLLLPSGQAATEPSPADNLVALRSVSEPVTQPTVPQLAPDLVSYRVSPGDTVAEIARAHNISQSLLISANRISDPNVIFVGQVLRVPGGQPGEPSIAENKSSPSSETVIASAAAVPIVPIQTPSISASVQASEAVTVPTIVSAEPAASAIAPSLLPQQVAAAPLSGSPAAPTPESLTLPATSSEVNAADSVTGANPFVQNLLAEIRVLREQYRQADRQAASPEAAGTVSQQVVQSVEAPVAEVSATPAAPVTIAAASSPTTGSMAINPQFQRRNSGAVEINVPAAEDSQSPVNQSPVNQPQTVAAAPLGSENYEPLLRPVTGRMVSPDLPPLPGADNFLPNQREVFDGYIWPARGMLTSGYGWRWGRMHRGIDIANDVGTPIHAAADGVVEYAGWNSGGYGNMVEIRHADGSMTRYAHLNRILVRSGQRIQQNGLIGEMGSTGFSTGPHLHFEVHLAAQGTVNPVSYLPSR
ncbi:peptidoglycan DD-metalloendopeptidase family protein [Leptolyngbya ohadii]|uniref:peptidoglycan DD-metalloendopeptidase family protein n=1 Tax=Leptolyngbya ohadii TaxID=1962290 RepID=UPI0015C61106|nr:peptidoglycan DD-metalloendopeptidase family protein [Leptolyngbya ohadii]